MHIATTRAPRPASGRMPPWWIAIAVPASTGATEAARVAGRTADHQTARAVSAVEAADARPGLTEARVVGGDRQVAHDVKHVPAADRVARHHRHHRFGQAADLDLQVEHVQPADSLGVDVAVVAADALVAARAESLGARPGEDDHTN